MTKRVLGIDIMKGKLLYAVLEGDTVNPKIIDVGIAPYTISAIPELMEYFFGIFEELIHTHKPTKISYTLHLDCKKDWIFYMLFPMGLLNFLANKYELEIEHYNRMNFGSVKRLGFNEKIKAIDLCDKVFINKPKGWGHLKKAILPAWYALEKGTN